MNTANTISSDFVVVEKSLCNESKKTSSNAEKYKKEMCRIIHYSENKKLLDVNFKGYGIRIKNAENIKGDTVIVKYKGEIGHKNFKYML